MSSGRRSGKHFVLNDQLELIDKGLFKNNRREIRSKNEINPTAQVKFTEHYPTQCKLRNEWLEKYTIYPQVSGF